MAAQVALPLDEISSNVYRASRTQVVPKHTLFGSSLEQFSEREKEDIRNIDVNQQRLGTGRQSVQNYPGRESIMLELEKLAANRATQEKVRHDLGTTHQKGVNFHPDDLLSGRASRGDISARPHQWYKPEHLKHADVINKVGLNDRSSFNRDKYGTKPPAHKYALIGDILNKGMDFPQRERAHTTKDLLDWNDNRPMPEQAALRSRSRCAMPASSQRSIVDLPANIKHFFGSKVCDSLLSNQAAVNRILEDQKRVNHAVYKMYKPTDVPALTTDMNPVYESLGNASRQNIFPGYSIYNKRSLSKSTYTDDVHLRRIAPTDKYRYQRDELSAWAEHNALRNKLNTKWNAYFDSLPKASVTWDRNAKRPAQPAPQPLTMAKSKARSKKTTINPDNANFEEVVFKTPPITPPPSPKQPSPAKMPEYVKDDDFWQFFDQPLPRT